MGRASPSRSQRSSSAGVRRAQLKLGRHPGSWPSSGVRSAFQRPGLAFTDGSVMLLKAGHGGVPRLFTSASAFRDLGRNGAGPGEYRAALLGAAAADTVYVSDRLTQRLSVLDPHGAVVRSAPAPPGTLGLIWLPGRRELIVNAHIPDRNRIGRAYHAFDPVGNPLRSLAESEKPVVEGHAWNVVWRRTVVDPMGNLVASTVLGEVRIEKWSPDGLLMAPYLLCLPEFRAPPRAPPDQPSPPPSKCRSALDRACPGSLARCPRRREALA